jgi:hypothetical protein
VLRQFLFVPVMSFFVGILLLGAIDRRPEFIDRGQIATTEDATVTGVFGRWRRAARSEERARLADAARRVGFSTEQLRAAGRRFGFDGKQGPNGLTIWLKGVPGYNPASRATTAAGQRGRVMGLNALAVGATTLIGLPPVLAGLGLRRRLRPERRVAP